MKKFLLLFALVSSITFYGQKKRYYTEDFKEIPSAEGATYYSTYEDLDGGTQRKTYFLDGSVRNADQFSNMKRKIRNGLAESWYKSGALESTAMYQKGKMEGIQTRYYESGQVKRIENFKNDAFIDGKCFDENGTEIAFFPYTVQPEFPGGIKEFYKYVAKNFKTPNNSKGQIKISFFVEVDGTLRDYKILEGFNYDMNVETLRVLFNSPLWIPGKLDGKITRARYTLPLTFK